MPVSVFRRGVRIGVGIRGVIASADEVIGSLSGTRLHKITFEVIRAVSENATVLRTRRIPFPVVRGQIGQERRGSGEVGRGPI